MHHQAVTGYVLHARPYQEKRAIYQLFSSEFGVIHGVGTRGIPPFVLVGLFVTGKNALKSFSQMQPLAGVDLMPVRGQLQYALLYMNEVLCRLLALENACEVLWQVYHDEVLALQALKAGEANTMMQMKASLRRFERALFDELGVSIDFDYDGLGNLIESDVWYRFVPEMGFVPVVSSAINQANDSGKRVSRICYAGADLQLMAQAADDERIYQQKLTQFSQLQRDVMDYLLDYKPLHSRKLWQQSLGYQNS